MFSATRRLPAPPGEFCVHGRPAADGLCDVAGGPPARGAHVAACSIGARTLRELQAAASVRSSILLSLLSDNNVEHHSQLISQRPSQLSWS